ncbi:MAG: hypothetical protein E2O39_01815 [Planctomycetota bacterium]|nr:MAG: hypothetical protein E2O39_01815 [Planctomycetota bacterium]
MLLPLLAALPLAAPVQQVCGHTPALPTPQHYAHSFQIIDNPTLTNNPGNPAFAEYSFFGASTAIGDFDGDGNMDLAVGAPGNSASPSNIGGRVFVFWADANGVDASNYTEIRSPGQLPGDLFGSHLLRGPRAPLSLNRDTLIVSAPNKDEGGINTGAVYVVDMAAPQLMTKISPPDFQANMAFGSALELGDVDHDSIPDIVIGARGARLTANSLAYGFVFVYSMMDLVTPSVCLINPDFRNPGNSGNENFGKELVLQRVGGQVFGLLVTAVGNSDLLQSNGGAAFRFLAPITPSSVPISRLYSPIASDDIDGIRRYGMSMSASSCGRDFVISAPRHDMFDSGGASQHTSGMAVWYSPPRPPPGSNGAMQVSVLYRVLDREDVPGDAIEQSQYYGFMSAFGDIAGAVGSQDDLFLVSLGASTVSNDRIFIYDGDHPGAVPHSFEPAPGSSSHFAQYPVTGQLGLPDTLRLDQVILSDSYWGPPSGNLDARTGRVVILTFDESQAL